MRGVSGAVSSLLRRFGESRGKKMKGQEQGDRDGNESSSNVLEIPRPHGYPLAEKMDEPMETEEQEAAVDGCEQVVSEGTEELKLGDESRQPAVAAVGEELDSIAEMALAASMAADGAEDSAAAAVDPDMDVQSEAAEARPAKEQAASTAMPEDVEKGGEAPPLSRPRRAVSRPWLERTTERRSSLRFRFKDPQRVIEAPRRPPVHVHAPVVDKPRSAAATKSAQGEAQGAEKLADELPKPADESSEQSKPEEIAAGLAETKAEKMDSDALAFQSQVEDPSVEPVTADTSTKSPEQSEKPSKVENGEGEGLDRVQCEGQEGPGTNLEEVWAAPETSLGEGQQAREVSLEEGRDAPEASLGGEQEGVELSLETAQEAAEASLGEGQEAPESRHAEGHDGPETDETDGREAPEMTQQAAATALESRADGAKGVRASTPEGLDRATEATAGESDAPPDVRPETEAPVSEVRPEEGDKAAEGGPKEEEDNGVPEEEPEKGSEALEVGPDGEGRAALDVGRSSESEAPEAMRQEGREVSLAVPPEMEAGSPDPKDGKPPPEGEAPEGFPQRELSGDAKEDDGEEDDDMRKLLAEIGANEADELGDTEGGVSEALAAAEGAEEILPEDHADDAAQVGDANDVAPATEVGQGNLPDGEHGQESTQEEASAAPRKRRRASGGVQEAAEGTGPVSKELRPSVASTSTEGRRRQSSRLESRSSSRIAGGDAPSASVAPEAPPTSKKRGRGPVEREGARIKSRRSAAASSSVPAGEGEDPSSGPASVPPPGADGEAKRSKVRGRTEEKKGAEDGADMAPLLAARATADKRFKGRRSAAMAAPDAATAPAPSVGRKVHRAVEEESMGLEQTVAESDPGVATRSQPKTGEPMINLDMIKPQNTRKRAKSLAGIGTTSQAGSAPAAGTDEDAPTLQEGAAKRSPEAGTKPTQATPASQRKQEPHRVPEPAVIDMEEEQDDPPQAVDGKKTSSTAKAEEKRGGGPGRSLPAAGERDRRGDKAASKADRRAKTDARPPGRRSEGPEKRRFYTVPEDKAILEYAKEQYRRDESVKYMGAMMWKDAADRDLKALNRSWQSLRERFKVHVIIEFNKWQREFQGNRQVEAVTGEKLKVKATGSKSAATKNRAGGGRAKSSAGKGKKKEQEDRKPNGKSPGGKPRGKNPTHKETSAQQLSNIIGFLKDLYGGPDDREAQFYAFKALKLSNGIVDDAALLVTKYRNRTHALP